MLEKKNVSTKVKEWVHLSELEAALDEQKARIKKIKVKRCPLQRCNLTFINESDHRWVHHPDSSNKYWTSRPNPYTFPEMNKRVMVEKEKQDPGCLNPEARVPEKTTILCSKAESGKGNKKESPVTKSSSGKIESQIRVTEVTTTKASESGPVMEKNEEAPTPFSKEDPEKGGEKEN